MKNKFLKKIFILLAVLSSCFLFASFSPSLDGRAVVVNEGEMPSGLFAKTVGYLPGDTIIVSNVDGTSSVEILVIGSLDASEGVAIMLSPEAASAIGIDKKDNNIVKITKRSDKDERCTGTAVIAKGAEIENEVVDDEKIEETSPENEILPPAEETFTENVQTEETAETEEVLQPTEESFVEEDIPQEETFTEEDVLPETEETSTEDIPTETESEEIAADELSELKNPEEKEENLQPTEEAFVEDIPTEETFTEEEVLPETEETPTEDIPTETESEEIAADELSELKNPEEKEENLQPTEEAFVEEDIPQEETFTEEDVLPETEETPTEDIPTETESEEIAADELSELENPEEKEENLQPTEEAFVEEEILPQEEIFTEEEVLPETEETPTEDIPTEIESEEVVADELSELENPEETEEVLQPTEETFTDEEVLPETEETLAEKTPAEEKSDSEEYEAIVLIPVEPEENISSEEKSEEEIIVENLKDETEKSDIKIVESEQKVEKESVIEKYKVESLDELEKESYYIQIVVLKEESNIQKIVDEYGNNYPITIVPLKSKSAYQVLIGPISMDEYGTVLNRFKSYGYKDAFLRKIK